MNRFLALPVLLMLFVLLASGQAAPRDEPKQAPPAIQKLIEGSAENFIKRFDKNGDGYLTKDELPPRLAAAFAKFDLDSDGKLDKQEVEAMLKILRKQLATKAGAPAKAPSAADVARRVDLLLERLDTNKDGKISRDEAKGPLAKNFDQLDTNKDGYLDKEELRRAVEKFGLANQAGEKGKETPPAANARPNRPDFDALDRNADGRLTRDELKGTPFAEVFDQIDTNKDGKIDRKEFEAYLKKQALKKDP
jgi:Ca2+-binding EF-hand superfamily protein